MANMWQVGYWENFVGFADRTDTDFDSSNVDARGGKGVEFKRISADQRTVQGRQEPWTDDDGNSYPGTSNTAKLQYGTNYSKQVGDSISVQEGNKSSIQSQGWSNSVMEGISFSTTLGGSFSSTGGLSIGTHLGLKTALFVGPELSINGAVTISIKKGEAYTWETVTKNEMGAQKIESALKKAEMAADLKRTIGQEISTLADFRQIVGGDADVTAVNYKLSSLEAITTDTLQLNLHSKLRARIQSQVAAVIGTTQLVLRTNGTATLNGSIIKVG